MILITRIERNATWGVFQPEKGKYLEKYDQCADKWVPGLDKKTGQRRTGMDVALSDAECKEYGLTKGATLQQKFEKLLSFEEGQLSPNSEFWQSFVIIIPAGGLELNPSIAMDAFKIAIFKADPTVANGHDEAKYSNKFEYVMTSKDDEAEAKNNKRDVFVNACAKYASMSAVEINEALWMFGKNPTNLSPQVSRDELGTILDTNPAKFIAVIGDKHFKEKVKLIKMIKSDIIRKGAAGVGYDVPLLFGDIALGKGLDEAIAFLLNPENSAIYAGLNKAFASADKQ